MSANDWVPSGPVVSCTATVINQLVIQASGQNVAVMRFINLSGTNAFCAMVSASASVGDAANAFLLPGGTAFFVGCGKFTPFAYVSGATAVFVQAGYGLK